MWMVRMCVYVSVCICWLLIEQKKNILPECVLAYLVMAMYAVEMEDGPIFSIFCPFFPSVYMLMCASFLY